jgi:NADPH:quinone reductase-like Zn-dependent oxidoreductase
MKAIVYTQYGSPDVLHLQEIEKPTPQDNEILIRIRATPVNVGDVMARNFRAFTARTFTMPGFVWLPARFMIGFRKPRRHILGSEFAGDVEAVGSGVTHFKPGDAVFGYRAMNFGANAEYLCMPADRFVTAKPANMTYEQASGVPGGALTALSLLRRVNIQPGQKVLINGASGGIGSHALQLAKHYGAEVTGVCGTPRMELVKALGADHVIDYTKEDFTQNGEKYDLIMDVMNKSSFARCKNSLTPNGCYLLVSFKTKQLMQMMRTSVTARNGGKRVICALSDEKPEDLVFIRGLVEAGVIKSVVDTCYPLPQAADAHRYFEAGSKRGLVVITVPA